MRMTRTITAAAFAATMLLSAACSDEDGDGATTDEELEDVRDTATSLGEEIEEEVDGQDEGTNEDDDAEETTTSAG
ncbi:MAG: hypothetical protein M3527_09195 [Actinomycetota bacterium]|nr:hypothetical protein [Actinomycetota bacterium]